MSTLTAQDAIDRVRNLLVTLEDELIDEDEPDPDIESEPEPPVDPDPEPLPVGDLADTEIARVAATLAPGETAPLTGKLPAVDAWGDPVRGYGNLTKGRFPDGSSAPFIDTWTDRGHWDPRRLRTFFMGLRQVNRFLSYHAADNRWEEIKLEGVENTPPLFEQFGHLYSRTALDWTRGHFYRLRGNNLHRYIIDEDRWEKFTDTPMQGHTIEWHDGLDRLINVNAFKATVFDGNNFTELGETAVHGYHSSAKYNRVTGEMLLIGGNYSTAKVDIITAGGEIRHMQDAPFEFTISSDDATYDPTSGSFLLLHGNLQLWEYRPDLDEWRIAADWVGKIKTYPFHRYLSNVPFPIDELGVIAWTTPKDWVIYRHKSVFTDAPAIVPVEPPDFVDPEDPPEDPNDPEPEDPPIDPEDPPIQSDNLLLDSAAGMVPGEWRHVTTTWPLKADGQSFNGFQRVQAYQDGATGGADGMGWTQNLVHHEGKLMLLLMRDAFEQAIIVMEADGTWWRENFPEGFSIGMGGRRPFNRLTQDATHLYFFPRSSTKTEMGYMIRTPLDDPGVFERYGVGIGDDQMDTVGNFSATWVPDWDRFYAYTPGGKVWTWTHGEGSWTQLGQMPKDEKGIRGTGYAGLILWNPIKKELIVAGGQNFGNPTAGKVARLTEPMGPIEALPNMLKPDGSDLHYTSAESRILVDPRDGSYIFMRGKLLYRNDTAGGTYSLYEDVSQSRPFGRYEQYAPMTRLIDDIIVFVSHMEGVVLHRLK